MQMVLQLISDITNSDIDRVIPFSTGVIGQQLPMSLISSAIPTLVEACHQRNGLKHQKP